MTLNPFLNVTLNTLYMTWKRANLYNEQKASVLTLLLTDQQLQILDCLLFFCSRVEESRAYVCRKDQALEV